MNRLSARQLFFNALLTFVIALLLKSLGHSVSIPVYGFACFLLGMAQERWK